MLSAEDYLLEEAFSELTEEDTPFELEKICFDKQLEFISDPSKLKALFCTRRAAKSYTGGLYLVAEALQVPGCNCLYVGLTRLAAKGIVWKDVLKDIDTRNNLEMRFNGSELTATTRNGSVIYVTGADADNDEMEKLLGKKYRVVIIDEAASFSVDLRRLCYGILKPATADYRGTICLLGTSGNLTTGLFYDITTGKEPGWKLFKWTAYDNPYVAKQWQEEIDDIENNRPLFMETPLFKQWYLNEWVIDDDQLVYRFAYSRNEYDDLHRHNGGGWTYILGVDLGYSPDPSAFVVVTFHEHDSCLYVVECFKKLEMDITDVAERIKDYNSRYNINRVIIDGANKQAIMEIQKRHNVALTTADKIGKVDFIQIMNAEFIQGKIKLSPQCRELKEQYMTLIWDEKSLVKKEHPNCPNDLNDAALYAWRYCYQFLSKPAIVPPDLRNKDVYVKHTQKLMEEHLERQIKVQQEEEESRDMWNLTGLESEQEVLSYFINKRK